MCSLFIQVADICVDAILLKQAENKVVEVISAQSEPPRAIKDLFASVL